MLDIFFTLFNKGVKISSVHDKTKKMARPEAVAQLGLVLKRVIHTMAKYRHHGLLIKFATLDVKDGLWHMAVSNKDLWDFCYLLLSLQTTTAIDDIEIVVLNSLQMGWCKSPPFFLLWFRDRTRLDEKT